MSSASSSSAANDPSFGGGSVMTRSQKRRAKAKAKKAAKAAALRQQKEQQQQQQKAAEEAAAEAEAKRRAAAKAAGAEAAAQVQRQTEAARAHRRAPSTAALTSAHWRTVSLVPVSKLRAAIATASQSKEEPSLSPSPSPLASSNPQLLSSRQVQQQQRPLITSVAPRTALAADAVLVVDNGSSFLKAGVAGEDIPRAVVPSFCTYKGSMCTVGAAALAAPPPQQPQQRRSSSSSSRGRHHRFHFHRLHSPLDPRRADVEWDALEDLWEYIFAAELRADPAQHAVVMTEPPAMNAKSRDAMAELLFESFNVPALHIGNTAVLSLFAQGLTTGIAVDCGNRLQVVPVIDGFTVDAAVDKTRHGLAGLTEHLARLLAGRGYSTANCTPRVLETAVRRVKERACYVAIDYAAELARPERDVLLSLPADFSLPGSGPDGGVTLGQERFMVPEALFQPGLLGLDMDGLPARVHKCIMEHCPIDSRRQLLGNVVLSGGSTLFPGFEERLQKDLFALVSAKAVGLHASDLRIVAPRNRKYLAWQGASLLGALPQFVDKQCLSRAEYFEDGPAGSCGSSGHR